MNYDIKYKPGTRLFIHSGYTIRSFTAYQINIHDYGNDHPCQSLRGISIFYTTSPEVEAMGCCQSAVTDNIDEAFKILLDRICNFSIEHSDRINDCFINHFNDLYDSYIQGGISLD